MNMLIKDKNIFPYGAGLTESEIKKILNKLWKYELDVFPVLSHSDAKKVYRKKARVYFYEAKWNR